MCCTKDIPVYTTPMPFDGSVGVVYKGENTRPFTLFDKYVGLKDNVVYVTADEADKLLLKTKNGMPLYELYD